MTPTKDWCALTIAQTIPTMPGWCSHSKAQRLYELVIREKPIRSIELGVFGGRSFLPMALAHWTLGLGKVVGVDPWTVAAALEGSNAKENDEWWSKLDLTVIGSNAEAVIRSLVPETFWAISRRTSADHAADPISNPVPYGFMHQDSNHSEEISCAELAAYRGLMQPGALWIMDDTGWPSLQAVQTAMTRDHGFLLVEDYTDWRVYRVPR